MPFIHLFFVPYTVPVFRALHCTCFPCPTLYLFSVPYTVPVCFRPHCPGAAHGAVPRWHHRCVCRRRRDHQAVEMLCRRRTEEKVAKVDVQKHALKTVSTTHQIVQADLLNVQYFIKTRFLLISHWFHRLTEFITVSERPPLWVRCWSFGSCKKGITTVTI